MKFLKRVYIWFKRFRYRRGYGVHSPFAFGLVTDVVYERLPYYAYEELKRERRSLPRGTEVSPERVDRLLFRLANWHRPRRVLGVCSGFSLRYLAAGCAGAGCLSLTGRDVPPGDDGRMALCKNATVVHGPLMENFRKELAKGEEIDFLHLGRTENYAQVFEEFLPHAGEKTLVVIGDIYDSPAKREWWKQVVADERTGITFDLYDVGLVFFDRRKNKQHYIINF